jgi:hypothetical protein
MNFQICHKYFFFNLVFLILILSLIIFVPCFNVRELIFSCHLNYVLIKDGSQKIS